MKKSADNFISLHPLVREICCKPEVEQAQSECRTFVEKYSREISALSLLERISHRRERMEIVSNAADLLPDTDGQLSKAAGELNYLEGQTRNAFHYYMACWKTFIKLNPEPDTLEALEIVEKIAWAACGIGEFNQVVHHFIELVLGIAERKIGSECAKLLPYYISFADICWRAKNSKRAAELYSIALKITEKNNIDDFNLVKLYINCARFSLFCDDDKSVLPYANRAIEILRHRHDFPLTMTAKVLEILAEWTLRKDFKSAALTYSCEATKVYERYFGKEHPQTADSYIRISRILNAKKDFDAALKYLNRAQKILEGGQVDLATSKVYFFKAITLRDKGELDESYKYFVRTLKIYVQVFGKNHPDTLQVVAMCSNVQKKMREFQSYALRQDTSYVVKLPQ